MLCSLIYEICGAGSIYHGRWLGTRRQFSGGFSAGGDYTFSKSIDNAGSVAGSGRTIAQDVSAAFTPDETEFNIFNTDQKLAAIESLARML